MIIFKYLVTTFEASIIFEAAVAIWKIVSILKPFNYKQINQDKLAQFLDARCTILCVINDLSLNVVTPLTCIKPYFNLL